MSPENAAWCRRLSDGDVEKWPEHISTLLAGGFDHLKLRDCNRRYGRRFRSDLQLSAHLTEWSAAAYAAAESQ